MQKIVTLSSINCDCLVVGGGKNYAVSIETFKHRGNLCCKSDLENYCPTRYYDRLRRREMLKRVSLSHKILSCSLSGDSKFISILPFKFDCVFKPLFAVAFLSHDRNSSISSNELSSALFLTDVSSLTTI